jgi:IS30 family transposase
MVSAILDNRPRKLFGWKTPTEAEPSTNPRSIKPRVFWN